MTAKSDAFADIEASYVAFRDLMTMLGDAEYSEIVSGEWTLAQLLAHMAGWYRELAPEFARILAGNRTPVDTWSDTDAWNARFAAEAKYGMAALDDFDLAFHDFYAAAKAMPEEAWGNNEAGRPRPVERFFRRMAAEHTAEHQQAIEAWLARR